MKALSIPRPRHSSAIGRKQLLGWASEIVCFTIKQIDELRDGQVILRICDSIWPGILETLGFAAVFEAGARFDWQVDAAWSAFKAICTKLDLPLSTFPIKDLQRGNWRACYQLLVMLYFLHNLKQNHHLSAEFAHPIEYKLSEFLQSAQCVRSLAKGLKGQRKKRSNSKNKPYRYAGVSSSMMTEAESDPTSPSTRNRTRLTKKRQSRLAMTLTPNLSSSKHQNLSLSATTSKLSSTVKRKPRDGRNAWPLHPTPVGKRTHDAKHATEIGEAAQTQSWKEMAIDLKRQLAELKERSSLREDFFVSKIEDQKQKHLYEKEKLEQELKISRENLLMLDAEKKATLRQELASEITSIDGALRQEEEKVQELLASEQKDSVVSNESHLSHVVITRQRHLLALRRISVQNAAIMEQGEQIRRLRSQLFEERAQNAKTRKVFESWVEDWAGEPLNLKAMKSSSASAKSWEEASGKIEDGIRRSRLRKEMISSLAITVDSLQDQIARLREIRVHHKGKIGVRESDAKARPTPNHTDSQLGARELLESLDAMRRKATAILEDESPDKNLDKDTVLALYGRKLTPLKALLWEMSMVQKALANHLPASIRTESLLKENALLSVQFELTKESLKHAHAEIKRLKASLAEVMQKQLQTEEERFSTLHSQIQALVRSAHRFEVRDRLWCKLVEHLKEREDLSKTEGHFSDKLNSLEQQLEMVESKDRSQINDFDSFNEKLSWMPDIPAIVNEAKKSLEDRLNAMQTDMNRCEKERKEALMVIASCKEEVERLKAQERVQAMKPSEDEVTQNLWQLHVDLLALHKDSMSLLLAKTRPEVVNPRPAEHDQKSTER